MSLLNNILVVSIAGVMTVGIITYGTLFLYPLQSHRNVMIKRVSVIVADIVSESVEQCSKHYQTWDHVILAINELDDLHSDIALDQLIAELESIILYRAVVSADKRRDVLHLFNKMRQRLKLAITKDPNLTTVTIPKRLIVKWIKDSIKNVGS